MERFLPACIAVLFCGCATLVPESNGPRDFIPVSSIHEVPQSDPFIMHGARIEGDSLKFFARYGGGCKDHTFALYVSRSDTAKQLVHAYVWHNANNDMCKALIEAEHVSFDLRGLKRDLGVRGRIRLVSRTDQEVPFSLKY